MSALIYAYQRRRSSKPRPREVLKVALRNHKQSHNGCTVECPARRELERELETSR